MANYARLFIASLADVGSWGELEYDAASVTPA
jgi:hypothetical protein